MRTWRHKLIAFYIRTQLKWLIFRANWNKKPKSTQWILDFRKSFNDLALDVPSAIVEPFDAEGVKGLIVKGRVSPSDHTILFFHGGAYNFGSPKLYLYVINLLAQYADATIYLVDYRMSPEYTYKETTADAKTVYAYLLKQGINPKKLAIGGDSAGGGLTLALLQMLKKDNSVMPACVFCMSPWVDLIMGTDSVIENADKDYMLPFSAEWIFSLVNCYTGRQNRYDPLISPLYGEYDNLPPIYLITGGDERLIDENRLLADKIKQTNTVLTHEIWPDMPHDFPTLAYFLPEAKAALKKIADFTKKHLNQ